MVYVQSVFKTLTVVIQYDFVEHSTGWFPALILVDQFGAQLFQRERIGDGFAGRLDGELVVDVADGKPLAVHRANRNAPFLLGHTRQLRNVSGTLPNGGSYKGGRR